MASECCVPPFRAYCNRSIDDGPAPGGWQLGSWRVVVSYAFVGLVLEDREIRSVFGAFLRIPKVAG